MSAVERAAELRRRAVATGAAGQPVRAARMLHRALDLLPASSAAPVRAVRARILASLAYFEAEQGHVDHGLGLLDEAEVLAADLDNPSLRGNLHVQRGSILVRRGAMELALEHLDQAVRLLDGSFEDQCATLLNRSALHLYSGNLPAADTDLHQCLDIATRNGLGVLRAKARGNLSYLAYLRGDLPSALRQADAALRDPALLTSAHRAVFMGGRADALRAAGLTREADADLADAVEILRRERLTHDLAEALLARAQVALLDGRWADALRLARSARRQFVLRGNAAWGDLAQLLALQAQLGQGRRLRAVGAAAGELAGRLHASGLGEDGRVAALVAARALLASGDAAGAAVAAGAVGAVAGGAGAVAGGAVGAGGATRLSSGDRIGTRLLARLVRAELAGARGDRAGRQAELRGGLADVHRYQSRFGSLDLQTASALHGRRLAELGLADAVVDGRPAVVFAWSERARALTARLPPVRPPDDPHAAELLADLRGVRTALRSVELSGAKLAGQRVPELRRRRAALERQVRQRAWFTAGPADVERPVGLSAARSALACDDGAMVAYLAVRGVLHALVVRRSSVRLLPLGQLASATAVMQRVRADLDAAALAILPAPIRTVVNRSLAGGLGRLDAALWRPLAAMAGDGPVVVVPTSALGAVPWTLLPGLRGRPLAVVPSATWWLAARARPAADGPPVFAVGPGVPRGEAEVRAAATAWRAAAQRAPAVQRAATPPPPACSPVRAPVLGVSAHAEATAVHGAGADASAMPAAVGPSHEPIVLTGGEATSGAVMAAAEKARLLHVAAHGVHEPDNPLFSAIQLADGPLFGYDLPRAAALPSHVVLSACDLGLAEVRPGDEALGMTSALLHGGVASVVAGVGRVGDEVAGTAMVAYHTALATGRRPAVALADALAGVDAATPAPLVCFGAGW